METTNGKISYIEESLKKLSSSSKNVIGGFVMSLEGHHQSGQRPDEQSGDSGQREAGKAGAGE